MNTPQVKLEKIQTYWYSRIRVETGQVFYDSFNTTHTICTGDIPSLGEGRFLDTVIDRWNLDAPGAWIYKRMTLAEVLPVQNSNQPKRKNDEQN